jgi:hypothetical protein
VKNRIGRFKIADMVLVCAHDTEGIGFRSVMSIMSKVLVVEARRHWAGAYVEYTGISRLFDEVEEGDLIPEYELESTSGDPVAVRLAGPCPTCGKEW